MVLVCGEYGVDRGLLCATVLVPVVERDTGTGMVWDQDMYREPGACALGLLQKYV